MGFQPQTRRRLETHTVYPDSASGTMDPLNRHPYNAQEFFNVVEDLARERVETDAYGEDDAIACAEVEVVSLTDPETGEFDIRYEGRWRILAPDQEPWGEGDDTTEVECPDCKRTYHVSRPQSFETPCINCADDGNIDHPEREPEREVADGA